MTESTYVDSAWRPRHGTPGQHMDVHVIDSLPAIIAGIDHEPEASLRAGFTPDRGRGREQPPRRRRIVLCEFGDRRMVR